MKFHDGFWMMKEGVSVAPHTTLWDVEKQGDSLILYEATKPIKGRGDTLNCTMLTTVLSSPMKNVVKVDVYHHLGLPRKNVEFTPEQNESFHPLITKNTLTTGNLSVSRELVFSYCGRTLTQRNNVLSGYVTMPEEKRMVEYLNTSVGETFYGTGERFTAFVKNGQSVDIENKDGGTCSEQAYKNVPLLLSSKGYGIFVASYDKVSFEIESEVGDAVQFSVVGERLVYYLIAGHDLKEVLSNYTALAGRVPHVPAWSYGLWLSTSFTTDYNRDIVNSFIDKMHAYSIPLSVIHFDCFWMKGFEWVNFAWDLSRFPDPEEMIRDIHAKGLKVCVWINSYVGQKSPLFVEGLRGGFFLHRSEGSVWQWDKWQAGMAIVDFTNPAAVDWYCGKLKTLLDMGVDCFKTDFGERIPTSDVVWYDHSDPNAMHNRYTDLYNHTVFSLLEKEKGRGNAVLFARSATIGGERYPVHWGGDCSATYSSMAQTLRGGLSLGLCGFAYWSHDIGGFEQTASADIYKRWIAFGLFSSHSRLHGSASYRVPWVFDEEACQVLSFFAKWKAKLLPYLLKTENEAVETGLPFIRAMVLMFPNDPNCLYLDRQYCFGDDIIVAPVMNAEGKGSCYLPEGSWVHLFDGTHVQGPCWVEELYDYFSLPVFVREGTVLLLKGQEERYEVHVYGTIKVAEVLERVQVEYRVKLPPHVCVIEH